METLLFLLNPSHCDIHVGTDTNEPRMGILGFYENPKIVGTRSAYAVGVWEARCITSDPTELETVVLFISCKVYFIS